MLILGRLILIIGLLIVVIGLLMMYGHQIPFLGKLPGDVHIDKKNFHIYIPLTTSILISLILSILFYIIRKR